MLDTRKLLDHASEWRSVNGPAGGVGDIPSDVHGTEKVENFENEIELDGPTTVHCSDGMVDDDGYHHRPKEDSEKDASGDSRDEAEIVLFHLNSQSFQKIWIQPYSPVPQHPISTSLSS
jgi:hypothetical protein